MIRNRKANLLLTAGGIVLGLSALLGLFLALFAVDNLVWPMLLFEPIVLGSAVATIAIGIGLQRNDLPMALATTAGCLAVAAILSTLAGRNTLGSGLLVPMLGVRLLIAACLGLWAAWLVIGLRGDAWRRLLIGLALLAAGAGVASLGFIGPARPVREWLVSAGGFIASAAALVMFLVFLVLTAAGVHLVVRPFEMALDARKRGDAPAT